MNWISIAIAVLLAAAVIAALTYIRKHRHSYSGCSGCNGCDRCGKSCEKKPR